MEPVDNDDGDSSDGLLQIRRPKRHRTEEPIPAVFQHALATPGSLPAFVDDSVG